MTRENFNYREFKTPNDKITGSYQVWNEGDKKRTKLTWINATTGWGGYIYDIDFQTARQILEGFGMFEDTLFHGDSMDLDEMVEDARKDILNRIESLNALLEHFQPDWERDQIRKEIKEKLFNK